MRSSIKFFFFVLAAATLTLTSCEKAPIDCTDLYADVSRAQTTYYDNPTTANCETYSNALMAYANASCQDSAGYLEVVATLPCK